jgi:hypothetical protein
VDRLLDEWEARRLREPSLTLEDFVAGLGADAPTGLVEEMRRAAADLDWVADLMRRIKKVDRRRGRPGHKAQSRPRVSDG